MAEISLYLLKDYDMDFFFTCMCNMYYVFVSEQLQSGGCSILLILFVLLSFVISSSMFQWSSSVHMDSEGLDLQHC